MVPLYVKYMGAEAYGLVGFFTMLQAFFHLFDMGLTPTMARETARYNGGALSILEYRRLARALEGVFSAIALAGGFLLFISGHWIASRWLNSSELPTTDITQSLQLMAIIVALRWMCGLYRGVITGTERLVWLSAFNSAVATGRFVLVLPVLMFVSASPLTFFGFQVVVSVFEFTGLAWQAYQLFPSIPHGQRIRWEWAPLKPVIKFSLTIGFTSSVWVLVTQTDKLVLSKILPLADYGYFTVAVLISSGIMVMSGPISSAIMPRMARLQAEGNHDELIAVYRQATQMVAVVASPVALVLVFFSRQVLWAWTGNATLVDQTAPILSLYAAGYGVLAISAFPYYLQYAKGNLRLHFIGSAFTLFTLIPSVVWAAMQYGIIGPGWAWLISNAIYLLAWIPFIHHRFAPGLHWSWLTRDVGLPMVLPSIFVLSLTLLYQWPDNRLLLAFELIATFSVLLILSLPLAGRIKVVHRGLRFAS